MEYLSACNRYGEQTGERVERNVAHRDGIHHRVFHLWIINSHNQVLIQQRSASKESGANLWYVSVGGHIEYEEAIEQAIVRETKEELGLDISGLTGQIQYLYSFFESGIERNQTYLERGIERDGSYLDNEFYDVFLLRYDAPLNQIVMQGSEVQAVKYIDYADFKDLLTRPNDIFVPHKFGYKLLIAALDDFLH